MKIRYCPTCGQESTPTKYCEDCYGLRAIRFRCGHLRTEENSKPSKGQHKTYYVCRDCDHERRRKNYAAARTV